MRLTHWSALTLFGLAACNGEPPGARTQSQATAVRVTGLHSAFSGTLALLVRPDSSTNSLMIEASSVEPMPAASAMYQLAGSLRLGDSLRREGGSLRAQGTFSNTHVGPGGLEATWMSAKPYTTRDQTGADVGAMNAGAPPPAWTLEPIAPDHATNPVDSTRTLWVERYELSIEADRHIRLSLRLVDPEFVAAVGGGFLPGARTDAVFDGTAYLRCESMGAEREVVRPSELASNPTCAELYAGF